MKVKALLLDLSGTLHIGSEPTRNAAAALEELRKMRIPFRFCSNTTKEAAGPLLERLNSMQFHADRSLLFTSLSATRTTMEALKLSNPLLLLSDSAREDFEKERETEVYDSVIVGLAPERLSYEWMNKAFQSLSTNSEAVLLATHKATYFRDENKQLSLGPGPFVSALEEASGKTAIVCGKPSSKFITICLQSFEKDGITEADWSDVAIVGDDIKNDLGGDVQQMGLKRVLVKTGKYRDGDEDKLEGRPNGLYQDFAAFVDDLEYIDMAN